MGPQLRELEDWRFERPVRNLFFSLKDHYEVPAIDVQVWPPPLLQRLAAS